MLSPCQNNPISLAQQDGTGVTVTFTNNINVATANQPAGWVFSGTTGNKTIQPGSASKIAANQWAGLWQFSAPANGTITLDGVGTDVTNASGTPLICNESHKIDDI